MEFSFYQSIVSYGDFLEDLIGGVNISYGERIADDTAERREALSEVLRIYINGELAGGELSRSQGNGHVDYSFVFDNNLSLSVILTLRVELGYGEEITG